MLRKLFSIKGFPYSYQVIVMITFKVEVILNRLIVRDIVLQKSVKQTVEIITS